MHVSVLTSAYSTELNKKKEIRSRFIYFCLAGETQAGSLSGSKAYINSVSRIPLMAFIKSY